MSPNLGAQHIHPYVKKIPPVDFCLGGKGHPKFGSMPPVPIFLYQKSRCEGPRFEAIPAWVQVGATDHLRSEVAQVQVGLAKFLVSFTVDFRYDLDAP